MIITNIKHKKFLWKCLDVRKNEIITAAVYGKNFKEAEEKICNNRFLVPLEYEGWEEIK